MGIDNVRKFLDLLNEEEKEEVVNQISRKYRYESSRKTKGQIKTAMMNFINGKNTTVEYLEVFLECIEKHLMLITLIFCKESLKRIKLTVKIC